MEYIPTIGLEIHAELRTNSKMFCSCKNDPDEDRPNQNICPICLGHPGTLPVLNLDAVKHVLKVGLAANGQLADFTEWDRKNYFYPDIPKGYQLSQYKHPLVSGGELAGVPLERIHLEEDTARSTHDTHTNSLVDFNRSGVPLMELVTKPAIHDASTAVRFAKELQLLLRYLGAGEANLEKGEMRIEANISVASRKDTGEKKFGVKTEVKNLNSFRSVERAIRYELERQSSLLEQGSPVVQETRGWDDAKNETYSQRTKESSHDYRYFPDPDIPKLKLSLIKELSADALRKELPELPWSKRDRYKQEYGMTDKEVAVFVENDFLRAYLEKALPHLRSNRQNIKLFVNYLLTDYTALLKERLGNSYLRIDTVAIMPERFVELIGMIADKKISSAAAKKILEIMIDEKDASPKTIAEQYGLVQKSSAADLEPAIKQVLNDNAKAATEYKAGKTASLQFLIGQAMKATKGAGDPEAVKKILLEKLAA